MRHVIRCLYLLALGCGAATEPSPPVVLSAPSPAPGQRSAQAEKDTWDVVARKDEPELPSAAEDLPDLGTRKGGSDWPVFLGPTGDSVSTEKGITPWAAEGPRVVWHVKLGNGYGAPSVSRGRLFVADRAGDQARLRCLNSVTGEPLWKFQYATDYVDDYNYSNGPRCSPVVDGNRVYLLGPEGKLNCVRAADGKPLWSIDTTTEFGVVQNFFGAGSTPAVEGDLLIVQVGGSPAGEKRDLNQKANGTAVVAFDKYTGKVRYKTGNELASYASPVLATVDKQRWCFLFARGGLLGLEPATGKVRFHYPWRARTYESVNASNPVIVGNQLFISETYGPGSTLLRIKPDGYEVVWKDDLAARAKSMQCHWNTPIHHDGYLYGSSGRHLNDAVLRCIELATGKVAWSEPNLTRTSLMMVDGHFLCLGEDGAVRLLKVNPRKYEEVSQVVLRQKGKASSNLEDGAPLLQEPAWAAPVLSHGLLYLRGKDRLVCVELIPAKR